MLGKAASAPSFVPPSPEVLKALRAEIISRRFTVHDLDMPSVASTLVAEPVDQVGLNEGIFYAEEALPKTVAALAPSKAVRSRPTRGTLSCLVLLVDFPDNPGSRDPQSSVICSSYQAHIPQEVCATSTKRTLTRS